VLSRCTSLEDTSLPPTSLLSQLVTSLPVESRACSSSTFGPRSTPYHGTVLPGSLTRRLSLELFAKLLNVSPLPPTGSVRSLSLFLSPSLADPTLSLYRELRYLARHSHHVPSNGQPRLRSLPFLRDDAGSIDSLHRPPST